MAARRDDEISLRLPFFEKTIHAIKALRIMVIGPPYSLHTKVAV